MEVLDPFSPLVPAPQKHPVVVLVCWNYGCNSKSRISAKTAEEAVAIYEDGATRGLYSSIYEIITSEEYDTREYEEYRRELFRIDRQTCRIFEKDLQLIVSAKATPAEKWYEIDPSDAIDPRVRNKLQDYRNARLNALIQDPCAVVTMPPSQSISLSSFSVTPRRDGGAGI